LPTVGSPQLRVWSAAPNGTPDANTVNDTLVQIFCLPLPAGTYTAGNLSSDFESIPDLLDRLYCAGIAGEVTINIDFPNNISGSRIEIGAVPGTSDTSRLIFDGGNDTISIDANSTIKHLMLLDSANYTTIQNFVLR